MKITYNELEKSIEIKDGLKKQHLIMKSSFIYILATCILFLVFIMDEKQVAWIGFIWILLGLASIGIFVYQILTKSAAEKLNVSEIRHLTEKQVFGKEKLQLKLHNGKHRDLIHIKSHSDMEEAKKLFEDLGVKVN